MKAAILVLVTYLALAGSAMVHAQVDDADSNAHRIFSELMSPYCPGLLLADCPSPDAFELRAEIRARLAAGETPAQVKADLYARFGDSIRATPEPRDWGLLLWTAPLVVLAVSFGGLAWYLAHRRPVEEPERSPEADRKLEHRLDDELERL
jgi:cytochrome c-type biogenesis protein CcmH